MPVSVSTFGYVAKERDGTIIFQLTISRCSCHNVIECKIQSSEPGHGGNRSPVLINNLHRKTKKETHPRISGSQPFSTHVPLGFLCVNVAFLKTFGIDSKKYHQGPLSLRKKR